MSAVVGDPDGQLSGILMAWADVYFRTKWPLHSSSRLETIDRSQKLGGALCLGALGRHRTQSCLGRGLPHTPPSGILDISSHLATTDIGRKLGGAVPHLTRCRLG